MCCRRVLLPLKYLKNSLTKQRCPKHLPQKVFSKKGCGNFTPTAFYIMGILFNTRCPVYIAPASTALAASPANVANSAPVSVYLVFVTFAVIKYTLIV